MSESENSNAKHRLVNAGKAHHQSHSITLQKGMRLALARVAEELFDLPLAMLGITQKIVEGDGLPDLLSDACLLMQLDGPTRARGAVMMDQALVGGLIQQQTIGVVREADGTERSMTETDAAMCAPLVDSLLERAVRLIQDKNESAALDGYKFGAKADDLRSLAIALDAREYKVLSLTVDVSQGVRQGEMTFVLPVCEAETAIDSESDDEATPPEAAPNLADTAMAVEAVLEMIVCQIPTTLDALRGLKPGDTLALPPDHFPQVMMTTTTGRIVGRGIVGQVDSIRAVKPKAPSKHAETAASEWVGADGTQADPSMAFSDPAGSAMPATETSPPIEMPDLTADSGLAPIGADFELPDLDATDAPGAPPPLDLPDLDLPPEAEGADATQPGGASGDDSDLPELEDMPDLADLADLSDLPPIQNAG